MQYSLVYLHQIVYVLYRLGNKIAGIFARDGGLAWLWQTAVSTTRLVLVVTVKVRVCEFLLKADPQMLQ